MILHSPVRFRKGIPTFISQRFGENSQIYAKWNLPGHNGLDLLNGTEMEAYGKGIVATHDGEVVKTCWDEPMSTKGNGVYIQWQESDYLYKDVYWHLSEILVKVGQKVKTGQLIGRMGNSGDCRPAPTPYNAYAGVHLHYGLYVYIKREGSWSPINQTDGYAGAVDPMLYFSPETIVKGFMEQNELLSSEFWGRLKVLYAPIQWLINLLKKTKVE